MIIENKLNSISIFFPCFNEEKNIPLFVEQAREIIPQFAKTYEIIIVNDGSRDDSLQVSLQLAKKFSEVKVVNHKQNKGYGAALKTGFATSKNEWIFFTDGDLQFDLKQLGQFIPFTSKYSVIIGYRQKRAEGFRRALNAKLFKLFVDLLFRLHVKDIDCAYKLIRSDAINKITLVSDGAFISSELLYRLKKKGYKFMQLPVRHYLRKFGNPTGSNIKVIIRALKETMMLYLFMKFGLFPNHFRSDVKH